MRACARASAADAEGEGVLSLQRAVTGGKAELEGWLESHRLIDNNEMRSALLFLDFAAEAKLEPEVRSDYWALPPWGTG